MRTVASLLLPALALALAPFAGAQAADPSAAFSPAPALEVAQYESRKPPPETQQQDEEERIRQVERELKERKRALKERERDERQERRSQEIEESRGRAWIGVGAGLGVASVDVPCSSSSSRNDCTEGGEFGTYSANFTLTGPYSALRLRGMRQQDKGNDQRTPYEEAAMLGSRFGHSNWYGLAGVGRILHADDQHPDDTHGFAWEILFAPATRAAMGLEISFQGDLGPDVDYFGVNVGMRFGFLQ